MSIVAIEPPQAAKMRSKETARRFGSDDFSVMLESLNPLSSTLVAQNTKNYQSAAVTSAAISGVAAVPGAAGMGNAPYYGSGLVGVASPFGAGGYNYGNASFSGGYGPTYSGVGAGGSYGGVPGLPGTIGGAVGGEGAAGSQAQETQALLGQMNDHAFEMLKVQVAVNASNQYWTTGSTLIKSKDDTVRMLIQNQRAT